MKVAQSADLIITNHTPHCINSPFLKTWASVVFISIFYTLLQEGNFKATAVCPGNQNRLLNVKRSV